MSIRYEMETHPERFPNGTWRKARPGRTWLVFLARKPTAPTRPPATTGKKAKKTS